MMMDRSIAGTRPEGAATDLVKRLFSRGEAFDVDGFLTFFTDRPLYQFGNFDIAFSKEEIRASADRFFTGLSAVYHDIKSIWESGAVVFVEMDVTYWRKDGSHVSLPCADVFRLEGDLISELRIFMDVNPVFDSTIAVSPRSSVFTVQGGEVPRTSVMRRFFAEHEEGIRRARADHPPRWSVDGPRWSIWP